MNALRPIISTSLIQLLTYSLHSHTFIGIPKQICAHVVIEIERTLNTQITLIDS